MYTDSNQRVLLAIKFQLKWELIHQTQTAMCEYTVCVPVIFHSIYVPFPTIENNSISSVRQSISHRLLELRAHFPAVKTKVIIIIISTGAI